MRIIFCDNLVDKRVDPDFEEEYNVAVTHHFSTDLISYEELSRSNIGQATSRIRASEDIELAIYRGWMLPPAKYSLLYEALLKKKIQLINTPEEYTRCHYLPESYQFIKELTPLTTWMEVTSPIDFEQIYQAVEIFKDDAIIVKDYVKSQKHNWEEACYIPQASNRDLVRKIVSKFLELQGSELNVGLVFRKFEDLEFLTNHSKSSMPLTKEFRLFFLNGHLIQVLNYWDEGDYGTTQPDLETFIQIGAKVKSNFFTMDIAKKKNGQWMIMELGEGQVSGLPDNANKDEFYRMIGKFARLV
jgi:hypothetical protein